MPRPQQLARADIDEMLRASGWSVQNYKAFDPTASTGIALGEVPLKSGRCDYLLLVNRKPMGIVEAKKQGVPLSTVAEQSVALLPLAEQTRIEAEVGWRLSVAEELEAVVTTNLQRAARLQQSIVQKAFTGEPQRHGDDLLLEINTLPLWENRLY